jgi:hypothetical protein
VALLLPLLLPLQLPMLLTVSSVLLPQLLLLLLPLLLLQRLAEHTLLLAGNHQKQASGCPFDLFELFGHKHAAAAAAAAAAAGTVAVAAASAVAAVGCSGWLSTPCCYLGVTHVRLSI